MSLQENQKKLDFTNEEKSILRELASQYSEIAKLPVHQSTISEWTRLNNLKPGRFLVRIDEVPWNEIEQIGDISLSCKNKFLRDVELHFKISLYMWHNFRVDMIFEPVYLVPVVIYDTGFGITPCAEYASKGKGVISRHFIPQIKEIEDISKIKFPEITVDWELTQQRCDILNEIFGDILKVESYGAGSIWFAPWDYLVMLTGVEEALLALAMRPDFAHGLMERFVDACLYRLEQLEKNKVLSTNNGNFRIGSGGLGYTDDLPHYPYSKKGISTKEQWGFATSQIFSEVSPAMHEEFALKYEKIWLERFGLVYYGCCEPLHNKIEILESIKNLRKISISPKADVKIAAKKIQNRYVISYKPNPAILASDNRDRNFVKNELKKALEIMKENGCIVEIIMKDISTIRYQPERLREWSQIAMELVSELA